eukprot:13197735-Alexandrium_andersonii.AAC.1
MPASCRSHTDIHARRLLCARHLPLAPAFHISPQHLLTIIGGGGSGNNNKRRSLRVVAHAVAGA